MSQDQLSRTINLPGAVFLIIGYVVGATIFILPGSLASQAGPAVYLAYLLAAIPAVLACIVMALIGSAVPVSGSIYVVIRDALSPALGFLYIWLMVALAVVAIPLVAYGFANYFAYFYPGLNNKLVALSVIGLFVAINYFGMKLASNLQNIMVIGFILVLLIFGIGGIANAEHSTMIPLFPNGWPPIMVAAITAYFSYSGVFVIAEVAGEIRNPGRTIPLAIFLSFIVIALLYVLVPFALTSVLRWDSPDMSGMAVVTAASLFLPQWVVTLIAVGALFAAATSINGVMLGMSRDLYKGAKTGPFPRYLAGIHPRFGTPSRAIIVVGALSLAGALAGGGVVQYAQIAVMGLMVVQVITGFALLKVPAKMAEAYQASPFKLGIYPFRLICICYIVFSVAFLFVLASEQPGAILPGLVFMALGFVAYAISGYSRN